jgi:DNA-binding response OmpR family regulator
MATRVLICDDDPVILRLLEVNLEIEGYEVMKANNGAEAYDLAIAELPDVIILDIMMPRLNGYETCQKLKENEATSSIPVVFLSAKAQQSDVELGKSYGVSEYLTKPFDPADLIEVVERLHAGPG